MSILRRLLGAILLLLATIGIVCCIAAIVGIWMIHPPAAQKVQDVAARLEVGLTRVAEVTQGIQRALAKARADVGRVNQESAKLDGDAGSNQVTARMLRGIIQRDVGPGINDLGGRLAVLSDSAVAVSSLLQSLEEVTPGRIHPDQLARGVSEASRFTAVLQKLQGAVGDGTTPATQREVLAAASEVDLILQHCQSAVSDWQTELDAVRQDLPTLKSRLLQWLWFTTIGVTVLSAWFVICQISLCAHAWKWCRAGKALSQRSAAQ